MALTDTKLRNLKPGEKTYREADEGGLFVDVSSKGKKTWGLRYWRNGKQERIGLGDYPTFYEPSPVKPLGAFFPLSFPCLPGDRY